MTSAGAPLAELPARWRAQAAELRALAAEGQARAFERAAAELEAALAAAAAEVLTLAEAVIASGIPERTLRQMLADGRVANAGRKHKPLIRRADLPKRPAKPDAPAGGAYDVAADARHLAGRLRAS